MKRVFFLWFIVPVSIYFGLIVFKNIFVTFILFYGVVCVLVPVLDFIFIQQTGWKIFFVELGFKNSKRSLLPAVGLGLFFCLFIFAFFVFLQKHVLNMDRIQLVLDQWQINKKYVIPFMLTMVVANSIFEEVYWRGYIYKKLAPCCKPVYVILLTSFFYASYHPISIFHLFPLLYSVLFTSIIFGTGVFWGYMRFKLDSIYFSVISHLLADLGIMLIYFKYFGR